MVWKNWASFEKRKNFFLGNRSTEMLVKMVHVQCIECGAMQEGYIEELTRFSQCLNAKTGFVSFWSVYQSFLYWIFTFQIEHLQKILEGQCLNRIRLTAPLYILLDYTCFVLNICLHSGSSQSTILLSLPPPCINL